MNRKELVRAVAAHTGQEVKVVDAILAGTNEVITSVVSQGEVITIPGFAKYAKIERQARMGRNPATGEQIKIKASKRARITPLKAFKDSVMNPSQAPKLARGVWPTDPALLVKKAAAPTVAKAPSKKAVAKKSPAKKTTAKKAPAKKAVAKKAPAKKAVAKKAPAKKAVAKKAPAKKTTAKKAPAKKTSRR